MLMKTEIKLVMHTNKIDEQITSKYLNMMNTSHLIRLL
jgi:hypothetical protein